MIAFVCGNWMQRKVQNKRQTRLGDFRALCISDDNVPKNTVAVEMTGEGDENNAIDLWQDYSIYAATEEN